MGASGAERSAAYRKRLKERQAAGGGDVGEVARAAVDGGVAVLWALLERGHDLTSVEVASDLASYRAQMARDLARGPGASMLRGYLNVSRRVTDDPAEVSAIDRALSVLQAAHFVHGAA